MDTVTGLEWPAANVDAPDAYWTNTRTRLLGNVVTLFDRDGEPSHTYVLDGPPDRSDGVAVGTVQGRPLTIRSGCGCGPPRRVGKKQP